MPAEHAWWCGAGARRVATLTSILTHRNAWILCGGSDLAHFVPCFVGDGIEIEQITAEWRHPHAL